MKLSLFMENPDNPQTVTDEAFEDLRKEADRLEAAADCLREDEYHRGAEAREKFIYAVLGKTSNQSCLVLATPINITRGLLAEVVE